MALKEKLSRVYRSKFWADFGVPEFDAFMSKMTDQDKKQIIRLLKEDQDKAGTVLRNKILDSLLPSSDAAADSAIAAGVISLDIISDKIG